MEVINGLVRNTLDVKRAALILRALHIAVKNAGRVRLDSRVNQRVREIPNYATPADETLDPIPTETGARTVLDEEAELPAIAAKEPKPIDPKHPHWHENFEDGGRVLARQTAIRISNEGKAVPATANVGADAACPEPSRRVRPAAAKQGVPAADITANASVTPAANSAARTPSSQRTNGTPTRKPPTNVNASAMKNRVREQMKSSGT